MCTLFPYERLDAWRVKSNSKSGPIATFRNNPVTGMDSKSLGVMCSDPKSSGKFYNRVGSSTWVL